MYFGLPLSPLEVAWRMKNLKNGRIILGAQALSKDVEWFKEIFHSSQDLSFEILKKKVPSIHELCEVSSLISGRTLK